MRIKLYCITIGVLFLSIHSKGQWTISNLTTYKADIQWVSQSGMSGYLVVRSEDGNIEVPIDPNGYQVGDYIGNDQVAYVGTSNGFTQTNLRASRHYEFMVFPYQMINNQFVFSELPIPNLIFDTPYNMMGDYYALVDSSQNNFISQLQDRVRNPYNKVSYNSYDETMIANFECADTVDGQKVVECVYSQFHHVYTPPFGWLPISREHTYCHSWMPSYPTTGGDEYADQHHLFPTQQNNANGVRSNHPFGEVETVQSNFLLGNLGLNSVNQVVYEPREKQKGDAARALLYMALRYDGVDSMDWTFDHLNNVVLPGLSEAPMSLDLLFQWHFQDLPDDFERARNDYIQSIQQNRNPFVDHPYWVNLIHFEDLTYNEPTFVGVNSASDFLILNNGENPSFFNTEGHSGKLTWKDVNGKCVSQKMLNAEDNLIKNEDLPTGIYYFIIQLETGEEYIRKWMRGQD